MTSFSCTAHKAFSSLGFQNTFSGELDQSLADRRAADSKFLADRIFVDAFSGKERPFHDLFFNIFIDMIF